MKMASSIHTHFFWPFLIMLGLCAGATKAGWERKAISSAEAKAEVGGIVKYINNPNDQIKALSEIEL